jgi:hypothetical protein
MVKWWALTLREGVKVRSMKDLLVILGILILCFELYRLFRGNWIRRFLKKKKGAAQPRKPLVMKPKSERDCPAQRA